MEIVEGFFNFAYFDYFDGKFGGINSFEVVARDYDGLHAEFGGFGYTLLDAGDGANFA